MTRDQKLERVITLLVEIRDLLKIKTPRQLVSRFEWRKEDSIPLKSKPKKGKK